MCMKSVAAGELNEAISRVQDGQGEAFMVLLFFYCNSIMKLDSARVIVPQRGRDRCALSGGPED